MTYFEPFHLTAFEWMMWENGGQPTPMTYTIRLVLSGRFDGNVFATAINQAILLHPLLCAHVDEAIGRKWQWIPAANPITYLHISDHSEEWRFPVAEHIDLRSETGLRVWVRTAGELTEVRFQFHHACCDGTGAYRVIEDILCAYDTIKEKGSGARIPFRPVDATLLTRRHRFSVERMSLRKRVWRSCFLHPARVGKLVAEWPAPIHCDETELVQDNQGCETQLLDLPTHRFSRLESRALRHVANGSQATTNELLLRDLILTLDEWNRCIAPEESRRLLRILVPISLRTKAEDRMPAANVMSLVSVTGRARSLQHPKRLLNDVIDEMALIRRWRVDLFWHEEAALACPVWGVIPLLRRTAGGCYFTSAFTNMGKLFARAQLRRKAGRIHVGGLTVETVDGAPPVSSCAATFGCHWYAGELVLAMNYDRRRLAAADGNRLMSAYVERLGRTADSEGVSQRRTVERTKFKKPV